MERRLVRIWKGFGCYDKVLLGWWKGKGYLLERRDLRKRYMERMCVGNWKGLGW